MEKESILKECLRRNEEKSMSKGKERMAIKTRKGSAHNRIAFLEKQGWPGRKNERKRRTCSGIRDINEVPSITIRRIKIR